MARRRLAFDPIQEAQRQWIAHGWDRSAEGMAVVTSVMRVQQILLSRVDDVLRPLGLTFARYELLVLLSFSRTGAMPLGKVGERLQVHPASVTSLIDKLESNGLVRRRQHQSDARIVLAGISAAGRRLVARATADLNAQVFGEIGLSKSESAQLFRLLRKLRLDAGDFEP
jgi:DNA-binding MarR family transcriptional regulator